MLDRLFGSEEESEHFLERGKYYLGLIMFIANMLTVMLIGEKYRHFVYIIKRNYYK
jgi:hypothetical protein